MYSCTLMVVSLQDATRKLPNLLLRADLGARDVTRLFPILCNFDEASMRQLQPIDRRTGNGCRI